MRILFMGSADFGIETLQTLHRDHTVLGVVSTPARPCGRGLRMNDSPIATFARKEGIGPVYTPEKLDEATFINTVRDLHADCFVVVAFRLLPVSVFSIPPKGTLNIHASLLPAYRGPAPIQRAIEAGETRSGVTVFRIDEGIDTGAVLQQAEVAIAPEETTPELYGRLSFLGAQLLGEVLRGLENGDLQGRIQPKERVSLAPKLRKSEGIMDWKLHPQVLFNKIRAFKPFPGTFTMFRGERLGIEWASAPATSPSATACEAPCGTIRTVSDTFFDVQANGGSLRVLAVKPQGRKSMSAGDFVRGARIREGERFQ